MTISSSWTEPAGFSFDEAFAAASGSVAAEAGGASREAGGSAVEFADGGAAELLDDTGMAGVLTTPASSGQREPTTDGFARTVAGVVVAQLVCRFDRAGR